MSQPAAHVDKPVSRSDQTADRSWMTWALVGLAAIWASVLAISLASPDLVSGSQHEHLPLALMATWIWGLVATISYLWGTSKLRGEPAGNPGGLASASPSPSSGASRSW